MCRSCPGNKRQLRQFPAEGQAHQPPAARGQPQPASAWWYPRVAPAGPYPRVAQQAPEAPEREEPLGQRQAELALPEPPLVPE